MSRLFLRISIFSFVLSLMISASMLEAEPVHAALGTDPNSMQSGVRSVGTMFTKPSRRSIMQEARNGMPDINSFQEYHRQLRELQQKTTLEDARRKHRRRVNRLLRKPGIRYRKAILGEEEENEEAPIKQMTRRGIRRVYPTIQRTKDKADRCAKLRGTRRSRCYHKWQNM